MVARNAEYAQLSEIVLAMLAVSLPPELMRREGLFGTQKPRCIVCHFGY